MEQLFKLMVIFPRRHSNLPLKRPKGHSMIILEDDKQYPENCSSLFFHHLRILSLRKEVMGMLGEFENILAS